MVKKIKIIFFAVVAVIFIAFYTLGYDMPYVRNQALVEPLLTPVVLWLMIIMLVVTLGIAIGSAVLSFRKQNRKKTVNNVPLSKIALIVAVPVALLLLLTFLFGSSEAISINGHVFDEAVWLKFSNMFIVSAIVLIVGAIGLILYSTIKRHL